MNGELRGEGTGKNQKQAKEAAARQAWSAMGWGYRKWSHSKFISATEPCPQFQTLDIVKTHNHLILCG